jgi:membrane-bound lytic murein transglycosylase D
VKFKYIFRFTSEPYLHGSVKIFCVMQRIGFLLLCILALLPYSSPVLQAQEEGSAETNAGLLEQVSETPDGNEIIGFSEPEVRERLSYLPAGCTPLTYNPVVRAYLQTYLYKKPEKTREMLARIPMWFHLFEQELKAAGMPEELKYLSVTESALNPLAVSHCGATGLWQFMPATGREYGLEQNSAIDERSAPIEATRAAIKYLKTMYNNYGDWALALAAYNSGPGNVSRAIKKAHSKNFWVIQKYLPRETRNYVPAFISATYICNFYMMHNLMPNYNDLDMQITAHTKVFASVAFQEIVDATGVDFNTLIALNPGFKSYYVPGQVQGRYLVLPVRVMEAFNNYMRSKGDNAVSQDFSYITWGNQKDRYSGQHFNVPAGDNADRLSQSFGCNKSHLVAWNHLPYQYAAAGKSLLVWRPNNVKEYQKIQVAAPKPTVVTTAKPKLTKPAEPLPATPTQPAKKVEQKDIALPGVPSPKALLEEEQKFIWHVVQRNESLSDIGKQYGTSSFEIQKLNGAEKFGIGARIKVKSRS